MRTRYGNELNDRMFAKKLESLVGQFFKILPIRESGEPTLIRYMQSLQREMLGLKELIIALDDDAQYLTLLSIIQYMIDHECDVPTTKSEVFRAISILKRMKGSFESERGGDHHGCVE